MKIEDLKAQGIDYNRVLVIRYCVLTGHISDWPGKVQFDIPASSVSRAAVPKGVLATRA